MIRRLITVLAVVAATVTLGPARAQGPDRAVVLLEAAKQKEALEGDVPAAIKQYEAIVSSYAVTNRPVAAQALLSMAEAYRKLGDSQARAVYERILREFSDQGDAVRLARAQLGAAGRGRPAASQRAVWTGRYVDMFGQVSPDGRLITFVDWARSMNLMVHDVVNNTDRALTSLPSFVDNPSWVYRGEAGFSTISKDGAQVAYSWTEAGRNQIRVLPLQASPGTTPTVLMSGAEDIAFLRPYDWSPDGQWIAAAFSRKDGTGQIALISARNGSVDVLKSVGWRGPRRIFFAPDSKSIAYDLPASDDADTSDVFIMPLDASQEIRAVEHSADDHLVGWSPDGTRLLFSSDRTGTPSLWAQQLAAGRPRGAPELLRADSGDGFPLGLTASGTLFVFKAVSDVDVRTAAVDLEAGQLLGPPASFDKGYLYGATIPNWSPDGQYLTYQVGEGDPNNAAIAIRTISTGEVRRLPGLYARDPRWSPDAKSVITAARDRRGRNGIFQVNVETGESIPIVLGPTFGASPQWSAGGTSIYYKSGSRILERDLRSGSERDVFTHPRLGIYELSPDGRTMAVRTRPDAGDTANVVLVSVSGDEPPREILPAAAGHGPRSIGWTPDSTAVIVRKGPDRAPAELWILPVDGTPARKLDISGEGWVQGTSHALDSGFSLSRDGRRVAFLMGTRAAEVWAVENFLPEPAAQ